MKRAAVFLLIADLLISFAVKADEIGLKFNEKDIVTSVKPFKADNVVMVPLRPVADKLGIKLFYNAETMQVYIIDGECVSVIKIGSRQADINGKTVTLERKVAEIDGCTVVPARLIGLVTNAYISYDIESNTVTVTDKRDKNGVFYDSIVKVPENELLKNPDFEISDMSGGEFGWKKYGYGSIEVCDDGAFSGENCIAVRNRTQKYSGISQDISSILKENGMGEYKISAYIKTDENSPSIGNSYGFSVRIASVGDENKFFKTKKIAISDNWTLVSVTAELKWKGDITEALLYFEGSNTDDLNDYYVDLCSMVKID